MFKIITIIIYGQQTFFFKLINFLCFKRNWFFVGYRVLSGVSTGDQNEKRYNVCPLNKREHIFLKYFTRSQTPTR